MDDKIEKPWHDPNVMNKVVDHPYIHSDEDIAEHFRAQGYTVARRTITDARNALGIPKLTGEPELELALEIVGEDATYKKRAKSAPSGLTPGIKIEGSSQVLITEAMPPGDIDWDEQIRDWGLDPQEWTVKGDTVKFSVWEQRGKEDDEPVKLWSWKGELVRRSELVGQETPDYTDLIEEVRQWEKPLATGGFIHKNIIGEPKCLLVNLADWQIGSADNRGTTQIVKRVMQLTDELEDHVVRLQRIGYGIDRIHVQGLGDLFEGCTGHYAMQEFTVELDRREQTRVVRRLLVGILRRLANISGVKITVGTVPGNHGEHRNGDGKAFTRFGDNDDVAVFEQVAEICAESPALKDIVFTIPDQELTQTFDLNGTIVGFAHAHQATKNTGAGKLPPAQAKVHTWWKDMTFGGHAVGDADILITGHYHHFSVIEHGQKIHMQCPAMDDGSVWFTNQSGQHSRPGTLTLLVGQGGYEAIHILGGSNGN